MAAHEGLADLSECGNIRRGRGRAGVGQRTSGRAGVADGVEAASNGECQPTLRSWWAGSPTVNF